jgi:hypothetical protein
MPIETSRSPASSTVERILIREKNMNALRFLAFSARYAKKTDMQKNTKYIISAVSPYPGKHRTLSHPSGRLIMAHAPGLQQSFIRADITSSVPGEKQRQPMRSPKKRRVTKQTKTRGKSHELLSSAYHQRVRTSIGFCAERPGFTGISGKAFLHSVCCQLRMKTESEGSSLS